MPKVSIIIPTHNRAALLARAIESAQHAGADSEVIVVDDASTDNTPDLCAGLAGIRYVRLSSNRGTAQARNVGIAESSSQFIAFLDHDDLRMSGSLAVQLRALDAEPEAAFCYGRCLIADARRQLPTGEIYPENCPEGDVFWQLLENNFVPLVSVVTRKRCLVERNLFNPELLLVGDWDMWLRLTERYPVVAVAEPVAIHRRANAVSRQMSSDSVAMYRQMLLVQEMALRLPRARSAPLWQRRRARRRLLNLACKAMVGEASNAMSEGDPQSARVKLREAFRFRPFRTMASGRLVWLLR
jgi:glycosyltransferase involved in cell wall biosynthesis